MTSPNFVFYLTCLFLGEIAHMTELKQSSSVRQERRFVSANVGENVTLQCFYHGDRSAWIYWYKQTFGLKPKVISTKYAYKTRSTFSDEFKNNPRFSMSSENGVNNFTISDLHISDSATYFCATGSTFDFKFAEGTVVHVKGSGFNALALVHQSESKTIRPGNSVTLNCTVHTGTCDGEHSVYWFRSSGDSHPGLIYTHGGRNDQCKSNKQTHSCVYNLPMESLDLSHAGTYYCAVASCGHIVFGDGTKLDFEEEVDSFDLVYFLSGALTFTTILAVVLAFSLYKMTKRNGCQSTANSQVRSSAPSTSNAEGGRDRDDLHYAALSVNLPNRSRRPRSSTNDECVYSAVKL